MTEPTVEADELAAVCAEVLAAEAAESLRGVQLIRRSVAASRDLAADLGLADICAALDSVTLWPALREARAASMQPAGAAAQSWLRERERRRALLQARAR